MGLNFSDLQSVRIGTKDFIKGTNSSEHLQTGGAQNLSGNVFEKPGLVGPSSISEDSLTDDLPEAGAFAWAQVTHGLGTQNFFSIWGADDVNSDGEFYSIASSDGKPSKEGTTVSGQNFGTEATDMIGYKGHFYTTSESDIIQHDSDYTSRDINWWTSTKGQSSLDTGAPHPMVNYFDIMYIADGRYLHQNDNGTVQSQVLDLGEDWVITALEVHNGRIWIAAEPYNNFNDTAHGRAKIFTWNGFADTTIKSFEMDHRINAMLSFNNILYLWDKKSMKFFDGSRFKSLRPIENKDVKILPQHITTVADSIFYCDDQAIFRYGAVAPGSKKRFYKLATNSFSNSKYVSVKSFYKKTLYIVLDDDHGGDARNAYIKNVDERSTSNKSPGADLVFNTRFFKQPVKVYGCALTTRQPLTSNQEVEIRISYSNQEDIIYNFDANNTRDNGNAMFTRSKSQPIGPLNEFSPILKIDGDVFVKAFDIYYKPVTENISK